jgi:hypothetical protein
MDSSKDVGRSGRSPKAAAAFRGAYLKAWKATDASPQPLIRVEDGAAAV